MKAVCIIPARLNSYRFPRKALHPIFELPVIEHVYRRAKMARSIKEVYVSTPDQELIEVVEGFGGEWLRTTDDVRRANDRVAQASASLDYDVIVNLQGDEPLVSPGMLDRAVQCMMEDTSLQCVNVVYLANYEHARDENEIKVVTDNHDYMMYLSREPIPARWLGDKVFQYKIQVGITVFSKSSLELYASLPSTELEVIESIDLQRFLQHRIPVKVLTDPERTQSVDAPGDIEKVEALMRRDRLFPTYAK